MKPALHIGIVLLLLSGAAACGHSLERETEQMLRLQGRAAEVLQARDDADSLAAAALFTIYREPGDALALIARAAEADPGRPEIAWLRAQICASIDGCNATPFEDRLRELDPENGIVWFGALHRAFEAGDETALDAALAAAARSERVNTYYTTIAARLSEATVRAGALSLPDAILVVFGAAGIGLPDYLAVSKACAQEQLQRPGRLETCRLLADLLMAGDTVLTEMIGVAIAKRAWPADSPQWKAAAEARRVYHYRSEALRGSGWISERDDAMAAAYLQLLAQHPREQDLLLAQLTALGIDPVPPSDWTDD